jgi:thymidine kinase
MLDLIVGSMFSGKSTELIRRMQRAKSIGKACLMVNHSKDTRVAQNKVGTHSKLTVDAVHLPSIQALIEVLRRSTYDAVFVDEAQFFTDLESVAELAYHYDITLAGLVSDYQQNIFGKLHLLMCKADDIQFQRALCAVCRDGTPASFSKRVQGGSEQVLVGAEEYMAVCRKHSRRY